MTLQNQVTNLDLSKRLKELGVKQESLFYWAQSEFENEKPELTFYRSQKEFDDRDGMGKFVGVWSHGDVEIGSFIDSYSAFTVAELGEIIGAGLQTRINMSGNIVVTHTLYEVGFTDDYEANARAKMLIYLLENKLISL